MISELFKPVIAERIAILVFKTSLHNCRQVTKVKPHLDAFDKVQEWSVDVEDCDHVLRIVGREISPHEIITLLQTQGVRCEILP